MGAMNGNSLQIMDHVLLFWSIMHKGVEILLGWRRANDTCCGGEGTAGGRGDIAASYKGLGYD